MATSNETRVRVEGLSKIIASVLPASGCFAARARSTSSSSRAQPSMIARRSAAAHRSDRGNGGCCAWPSGCALAGCTLRSRRGGSQARSITRDAFGDLGLARRSAAAAAARHCRRRRPSSSFSARSAATTSPFGTSQRRPISRPSPRTSAMTVGMAVLELGEPLLQQQRHPAARGRGSPAPARRRARHCRPPSRADCRRRSSHGCRRSCPCRLRRSRGTRRSGSRRRALGERHDVGRDAGAHDRRTARRCGRCRSAPRRRSAAGRARRTARAARAGNSGGTTRTPPSPWIGSIRIAAVSGAIAALAASRSPNGDLVEALRRPGRSLRDISSGRRRRASRACGRGRRLRR